MSIKLGNNTISNIYLGTNQINSIYLGTNLIWNYSSSSNFPTANDFTSQLTYSGKYEYASNMGYWGNHLSDQNIAQLADNAGSNSIRPSLGDRLISGYGTTVRLSAFQYYYNTLSMRDITAFIGEPNNPTAYGNSGPDNQEPTTFPGCDTRAKVFINLYEDIWLDPSTRNTVNPNNTFAKYIYDTIQVYGPYVKFWEVVNEADLTYDAEAYLPPSNQTSWWNVTPPANSLFNLKAPVYYYIRMLRIAWEVIKRFQPNSYVCTGGLGYPSFLDVLLRNTDNPVSGSVSTNYPLKGGAYFDVVSWHIYPFYNLCYWDGTAFTCHRHSDECIKVHRDYFNLYESTLISRGYDGIIYPRKKHIMTEFDISRESLQGEWGSQDAANNYIIKAHIQNQKLGILQSYKYGLADGADGNALFNKMGLYADLTPPTTTVNNAVKLQQWYAVNTLVNMLYNKTYDSTKTSQLILPSNIDGAAFKDISNNYSYVLWAKTTINESEAASASYTFPFVISGNRYEWNWSLTGVSSSFSNTVTLTGAPSFFI